MEGLTEKQATVINKLIELTKDRLDSVVTPTEVGLALGYEYSTASAKCMNAINAAVKKGYVKRVGRGKYMAS